MGNCKRLEEGGVGFSAGSGVFYNPAMELSRSLSCLIAGALPERLKVLDAFSASGIRGIRYAKECPNLESIAFLDAYPEAAECIRKNIAENGIDGEVIENDVIKHLIEIKNGTYNFIELDPFGTPAPFIHYAVRAMRGNRTCYVSATATDTAVLCGKNSDACVKNYHAKTMRNKFSHETGMRILIKRVMDSAHEFNFSVEPAGCFYYRHQIKTIIRLRHGAEGIGSNIKNIGYVFSHDADGTIAEWSRKPVAKKEFYDYAGPLWIGDFAEKEIIKKALAKAEGKPKEMLELILGEQGYPPFFTSMAMLSKHSQRSTPNREDFMEYLKSTGAECVRTHFDPKGIKCKCPSEELMERFKAFSPKAQD